MNDRLTKSDWIRHGLKTLAKDGPNALQAGPLSTKLNVSRGSFYWHFRDLADFRSQLLRSWLEDSTDQVIRDLEARAGEPDRLKLLIRRAFGQKRNLDRAMRSWAAVDKEVARLVASVDDRRVAYIAKLLTQAGVEGERTHHRAAFLYWAYLGQVVVMAPRHASLSTSALDDISDLFASGGS